MANGDKIDITFIPWPRLRPLRCGVLGALGLLVVGASTLVFLQIRKPSPLEFVKSQRPIVASLLDELAWPNSAWCLGSLLVLWLIAFFGFFRHRANAFVRLQIKEESKIWISYQRGLLGDSATEMKEDGYFVDKPQKRWGFLLQPVRGNAANEGQRHPQAVQYITSFDNDLNACDNFRPTGFRIAFSRAAIDNKKDEKKSYTLRRPKWNEEEPSFYKEHIEVVALNAANLPMSFYLGGGLIFALPPVAIWVLALLTHVVPIQVAQISVVIAFIVLFAWISLRGMRNRNLQENRYFLYFPKKGTWTRHSGKWLTGDRTRSQKVNKPDTGPFHQLLNELWLMSRFTGADIRVVKKPVFSNSRQSLFAVIKLFALSVWGATRKIEPRSHGVAPGNGR